MLLIVGIALVVFHSPLLQRAYGILVIDQPSAHSTYGMLMTPGPECYDATARMLADRSFEQVLIVDQKPRRSVVLGAMPEFEERVAKEFVARGITPEQFRVINTEARTLHQLFRQSDSLIAEEHGATCLVISAESKSRYYREIIDQALPAERANHYRVRAITANKVQASTWWRSLHGVRQVMVHGLRLIFVRCFGQSQVDPADPYQHVVSRALAT